MHIGIKIAAGVTGLVAALGPNTSGCTGGGPMPGQDEATGCLVEARAQNSKGQWYLGIQCDRAEGGPVDHSAVLLPGNDARAWPACTQAAKYPDCKNG